MSKSIVKCPDCGGPVSVRFPIHVCKSKKGDPLPSVRKVEELVNFEIVEERSKNAGILAVDVIKPEAMEGPLYLSVTEHIGVATINDARFDFMSRAGFEEFLNKLIRAGIKAFGEVQLHKQVGLHLLRYENKGKEEGKMPATKKSAKTATTGRKPLGVKATGKKAPAKKGAKIIKKAKPGVGSTGSQY